MKYVVIGGDAAGMSAAMQIIRQDDNAKVTTLEMGEYYSYAQCGLPYAVGGLVKGGLDDLVAREVETFREKYGIDARVNHEVKHVDIDEKVVSGDGFNIPYDRLLIATGASPIVPDWEGVDLDGIHSIKTIPDTETIMNDMKKDPRHIVVIGGGYIGLEMAENFVEQGKKVTLIQRGPQLGTIFDKEMAKLIHEEATDHGVNLLLNEEVKGFKGEDRVQEVITDKQTIKADMVIVAIGVKPNTHFLKETGIHLHESGAIKVNAYMETNIKDVYAAGDCATQYHRIKEHDDFIPLGTHANKQGRIAGLNMAGSTRTFKGIVGTSILKFFSLTLGRCGLSQKEADALHFPTVIVDAEIPHHATYYPGAEVLTIRLMYQRHTEQLLGAQIIGKEGVDKRVDVLATALYHKMTMEDLENLDLAYAPPYNGVWDPIQQAARRRG
ncbi:FAD-dependent oxidoreductase [Alkalihalophilus lindianensis]|uniref:FAD-dependent oxidoreductase n=1 Tax=Alkalihalophilus lindianensis TaxID=1630542 RepID=A0ABU3X9G9_9BACI|nr:FAD-dependent oxidoreductase [Alkalihalophilus lindianensis]MDV2684533.1 FAD-dependent oxidoreductase [Alkalihalophilus lindianensis]